MTDHFDPERFIQAQNPVIARVHAELLQGHKQSHWMWFVFPQLAGLGHSPMARRYALGSLDTAQAYLQHPILGARLIKCSELVNRVEGASINQIFGSPDDRKFHSSMTLFSLVSNAAPSFTAALEKYFDGALDQLTTDRLSP